jgi:N6-adenosine-specific RNA methylase IME4
MKYNVVYCDPPWSYSNKNTGGNHKSGSVNKYPTLSMAELFNLKIHNVADENCVLFLWATTPLLGNAFKLLEAWGFTYKTTVTWEKTGRLGMGFWMRVNTEHLLIAIKGKVAPFRCSKRNLIQHKPLQHSEKPEVFRTLIENLTDKINDRKMIEIFARKQINGWDSMGYDVGGTDIRILL